MAANGIACVTCHKGAEEKLGNKLVTANKLEPMPVEGKNGFIALSVQIAYDADNAYFRAQWKTRNNFAGDAHPFERFDGKEWKHYGYPKLDAVVQQGKQPTEPSKGRQQLCSRYSNVLGTEQDNFPMSEFA